MAAITDSTNQTQTDGSEWQQLATQQRQNQNVSRGVQDTMRQQQDATGWTRQPGENQAADVPTGGQGALYGDAAVPHGLASSSWAAGSESSSGSSTGQSAHDIESLLTGTQKLLNNLGNIDFSNMGSAGDQLGTEAMALGQSVLKFDGDVLQQFSNAWGNSGGNAEIGAGIGLGGGVEQGQESGRGRCYHGSAGGAGANIGGDGGSGAGQGEGSSSGSSIGSGEGGSIGSTSETGNSWGSAAGSGSGDGASGGAAAGTGDGSAGGSVSGSGDGGSAGVSTGIGDGAAGTTSGAGGDGSSSNTGVGGSGGLTSGTGDGGSGGTVASTGDGSGFNIQNGQLLYNGSLVNGVAVTGEYAQQVGADALANQISSQFPGINVVRLATSPDGGAFTNGTQLDGGESVQDIDNVIQALNAKGIGVIVDNHGSDANTPDNVSQDGNEAAWFGQLAQDNLGNNNVMFQTENEPTGSDQAIVQEQQSAYDAIRATGSNAIVAFDLEGGGSAEPQLSDPAAYDADSNYVIDAHSYASNNPDPTAATAAEVAQTSGLTEANGGAVPVYIGETGNSIDGSDIDPAATQELNGVWSDGTGAIAWLYDGAATGFGSGNGADHLTDSNGNLTSYGEEIAQLIAAGAT